MKKKGILHAELSRMIARLGHGDKLIICDSGYPIPYDKPIADLALTLNQPRFTSVLIELLNEVHVERVIIAKEMKSKNPSLYRETLSLIAKIPVERVSHEKFKRIEKESDNVSFVRTGEASPYANIILVSGVVF
jgi:D-ribose pyranase